MPKRDESPQLWTVDQIARYLNIGHESVRKALWRKGIGEVRGYSATKIKAAWPKKEVKR